MNNTKHLVLWLVSAALFAVGCQQSPKRDTRRFGRTAFGVSNGGMPLGPTSQGINVINGGGDMVASYMVNLLAAPALSSMPEQRLGYVNAQTGVRMWGEAYVVGSGAVGQIDGARSRIHIEVTDQQVGNPFVLHMGYDQSGFEGAAGMVNGSAVDLRFNQAGYGFVRVQGQLSGNMFQGAVYFSNTMSNGEQLLGNFSTQACAFFACY